MRGTTKYSKRVWLNDRKSPSTGNVVAFDGMPEFDDGPYQSIFLRISDCHSSVRLHKSEYDTERDFINKMKKLRTVIDEFIDHLEREYYTNKQK